APADGSTVSGSTVISASASDNVGVASVEFRVDGILLYTDTSSPYSCSWDSTEVYDGSHTVTAIAYDGAGYSSSDSHDITTDNNNPAPAGEKIAVFFWATDAGAQWIIDKYINILLDEGYTKFFDFKDTQDFQADFNEVDAYETAEDTVFMYLFGHGNYNGVDSYTAFSPGGSIVYSSQFRTMMDTLETNRKGFLIESCLSGGFPEDFQSSPYLAMSTSDTEHSAYAVGALPNEGKFSNAFWGHVAAGYNAVDSFYYACGYVTDPVQNPMIADYSSYVFFG
ncbi:MAG: Ig-like domain-containing protein, partial [Candidatus Hodarchaeales archaeon]